MKQILIMILILLVSCTADYNTVYIITYNVNKCDNQTLEVDLVTKNQSEVFKRLKELQTLEDVKLYEYDVNNEYFLYFTEDIQDCSTILQRCNKEDAVRIIKI